MKGFEFVTTLLLVKIKQTVLNFYVSSKTEIIINESEIDDVFQSIYTTIIRKIQKCSGRCSCWIIDSIIDHTINISKYKQEGVIWNYLKNLTIQEKDRSIFKILIIMNALNGVLPDI